MVEPHGNPKPKIYDNLYSENTMKFYAWMIARKYLKKSCSVCGLKNIRFKIHVHHKNKNRWDNRLKNLQILCAKHHYQADFPNGRKNWFKGRHHTKATKKLLQIHHLGVLHTQEEIDKISLSCSKSMQEHWDKVHAGQIKRGGSYKYAKI